MSKASKTAEALPLVNPYAAGLDIGSREIWVCVPTQEGIAQVKTFGTFTPDLKRLSEWLLSHEIKTVAMESTGVYWIPVFELLESCGLDVYLVNAHQLKHVPGRKSDYQDCQWIQKLHTLGLLTASFRPEAEMCALRAYLRHRAQLLQHRAPHVLHIQKALQQMNLQLAHVLSDITGETGMAILRAIVNGQRDPLALAQLRNPLCKSSEETLAKALTGDWKAEQLFVLQQSLELYDFYTRQLLTCDNAIQLQFSAIRPRIQGQPEGTPTIFPKPTRKSKNAPTVDVRSQIIRITGVDLVAVDGISEALAQTILSEIGTDMSRWPTDKHFASWLGLAPHNDISGGRVLRSRTLPTNNRAGQAFRQAATSVSRTASAFGAFYRRKRAQAGPQFAQVATAHKIARTVYHLLKDRTQYVDIGASGYEQQHRQREIDSLFKKAHRLGFTLSQPVQSASEQL